MARLVFGLTAWLALLLVAPAVAPGQQARAGNLAALRSKEPKERKAAFDEVINERRETIKNLIAMLSEKDISKERDGPLHLAICLLGELRAVEAIRPLCGMLKYLPEGRILFSQAIPTEGYYVAAVALVRIGEQAIPHLEVILRRSGDDTERKLAAWVIWMIEGKEQVLARLDRLIATSFEGKEHFKEARGYIENYKPSFDLPREMKNSGAPSPPPTQ
ncbi:MAG: hypothetical protein FJ291_02055 [Planctomycetes bacterium]|nr:hypothetical protein [Planctomycetota bacterium]